jgi:hypothetical protein
MLSTALYIASMAEVGTGVILTRGELEPIFCQLRLIPLQVQIAAMAWGVNLLSATINTFGSRGIGKFMIVPELE